MNDISGRAVILACVAIGVVMAGWAWAHQYLATRHAAAFWGPEGVEQLIRAEKITARGLGSIPKDTDPGTLFAGRKLLWQRDVSYEPGMEHLRHALTQDGNFRWPATTSDVPADWALALTFGEGDALTVLFDARYKTLGRLGPDGQIVAVDSSPMSKVLRKYFALVQFADAIGVEEVLEPADR